MTFVRAWICADNTRAFRLQPKVGDATSAKTMVRRSPGLLDLLRRPCSDKAIAWLLGFPYGYVKVKMVPSQPPKVVSLGTNFLINKDPKNFLIWTPPENFEPPATDCEKM